MKRNSKRPKGVASVMEKITINVPIVFMAQDVIILMWANSFRGPFEWVEK
jgi:hypothetical protein